MSELIQPPRTPWGNFPDVLIHASESAVKQHPAYRAAKAGHVLSATALVNDTMSEQRNQQLVILKSKLAILGRSYGPKERLANFQKEKMLFK